MFRQIHIDAARNATDDFNPFHDPNQWQRIAGNPFGGPIVLGFQLECLAEYLVTRLRATETEGGQPHLAYRNYQFTFAGALRPDEAFRVMLKPTIEGRDPMGGLVRSNRVVVRKAGGLVLRGQIRDSTTPLALAGESPPEADLRTLTDRRLLPGGRWFHKRKFMMNSNAKNLISGSLADQAYYFNELEDHINFPDLFPAALISCALLERAHATGHDFHFNPMVYTAHHISVDQRLARGLRSNDAVHLLVDIAEAVAGPDDGYGGVDVVQRYHRCLGLLPGHRVLFQAEVRLAPLQAILHRSRSTSPRPMDA